MLSAVLCCWSYFIFLKFVLHPEAGLHVSTRIIIPQRTGLLYRECDHVQLLHEAIMASSQEKGVQVRGPYVKPCLFQSNLSYLRSLGTVGVCHIRFDSVGFT